MGRNTKIQFLDVRMMFFALVVGAIIAGCGFGVDHLVHHNLAKIVLLLKLTR